MVVQWIPVKKRLPEIDRIVMVAWRSGYDGAPVISFGARVDEGDGWLWAAKTGYGGDVRLGETPSWNSIEADDDYQVTHWAPVRAPFRKISIQPSVR
jgi:hypothetical protein